MKPVALIGLGNLLMSDEGIGVRVVEEILRRGGLPDDVEVMDMGTAGLQVLHAIAGRRKAVFVDCAFMDEEPGALRRFTPDEVASRKVRTRLTLHEGDLLNTLALSRKLGECPEDVVLFGIQPAETSLGETLSPPLAERIPDYADAVGREIG